MPRTIHRHTRSSDSSIEVGSSVDSSSDSEGIDGAFDEGKADVLSSAPASAAPAKTWVPVCPTPVRMAVGVFSGLTAVGGCVMSVVGFLGMQDAHDADFSLHQGLLGGGIALLSAGGAGVVSAFWQREQAQPPATHA